MRSYAFLLVVKWALVAIAFGITSWILSDARSVLDRRQCHPAAHRRLAHRGHRDRRFRASAARSIGPRARLCPLERDRHRSPSTAGFDATTVGIIFLVFAVVHVLVALGIFNGDLWPGCSESSALRSVFCRKWRSYRSGIRRRRPPGVVLWRREECVSGHHPGG